MAALCGAIGALRDAIDARIRAALPGDKGAIASALITGKRDAISSPVNDAMYVSSLAHVLSISGYHMAVVAGVVFFVYPRVASRSFPAFASRYPIKKWAALAALADGGLLSAPVRRRGRDPARLHHDGDRADRRDVRPPGIDAAHDLRRGAGAARHLAGGDRASEFPDVVCGDARADRRL